MGMIASFIGSPGLAIINHRRAPALWLIQCCRSAPGLQNQRRDSI